MVSTMFSSHYRPAMFRGMACLTLFFAVAGPDRVSAAEEPANSAAIVLRQDIRYRQGPSKQ
jgi:hypothetical protein